MSKRPQGAGMLGRAKRDTIRPYTLRVKRDHGGGLWTLEDNEGQLYLAVLSYEMSEQRRRRASQRQADGSAYSPASSIANRLLGRQSPA